MSEYNRLTYSSLITSLSVIFIPDVNDCMPDSCQNGGNCTDGVNEYICICILGYTGVDCETSKLLIIHAKISHLLHTQHHI